LGAGFWVLAAELSIAGFRLPIPNFQFQISDHQFPISIPNFKFQISNFRLPIGPGQGFPNLEF